MKKLSAILIAAAALLSGCYDRFFPPYVMNAADSDVRVQTDSPPSDILLSPGGLRLSSEGQPQDYSHTIFSFIGSAGECPIHCEDISFTSNALFVVTASGVEVYDTHTLPPKWGKMKHEALNKYIWRSFDFRKEAEQSVPGYPPQGVGSPEP